MKVVTKKKLVEEVLSRGVEEVVVKEHLREAMLSGRRLRVKFGIDPTAPDLHLGHTVPLRKLREFQKLGHTAVLVIGDFTARIGDPTGRSEERKPLTSKEVKRNMKKYLFQAAKVLDVERAEIFYNSDWFGKEGLSDAMELARSGTVQQMLHRADFKKRIEEGHDITLVEVLYPILQGYDSVKVKADVELGGTDQTFNLLMGRKVQRHFEMPEQDIMTVPLMKGTDGERKMSKSFGNAIALEDPPTEMFGKIMSIPDKLISKYFEFLTNAEPPAGNPREAKLRLGEIIVEMYHGKGAGAKAREAFLNVFSKKEKPDDIPRISLHASALPLVELLVASKLVPSKSEARRLITQGAIRVDEAKKTNPLESISLGGEKLLQVGPRRFLKVSR